MRIKSWTALDTYTFELVLDSPYYPALQELTYIRPLRMLSMNAMPGNGGNTCPPGWGTLQSDDGATVECKGHTAPIGTGPYLFKQTITNKRIVSADQVAAFELDEGEEVTEVHFTANANYWGGTPAINQLVVRSYASHTDVLEALLDQSLDVAHSSLEPQDIKVARDVDELTVQLSPPLNTRLIVLNSARGPTQSLAVRKAIIHGINKAHIVQKELGGLEEAAHSVFSRNTPYANIDLYPLLDFDAEKAALLLEADGWVMERGRRSRQGENLTLEFIYVEDNAVHKAIEDDVRADLAKLGIDVKAVPLDKDEWNERATSGEFELAFSETWGPPYDPHTFAASWRVRNEADYAAQLGMRNDNADFAAPMNKTELDQAITDVLATEDETQRQEIWTRILTAIHEQAIYEPISFMRNTAVMNQGFENFLFGGQQFDIPVAQLRATNSAEGAATAQESGSNGLSAGAIAGITVAAVCAVLAFAAMLALIYRERQGKPMFAPLLASEKRSDMA
jgi:nickel transport system substrate-binding protein